MSNQASLSIPRLLHEINGRLSIGEPKTGRLPSSSPTSEFDLHRVGVCRSIGCGEALKSAEPRDLGPAVPSQPCCLSLARQYGLWRLFDFVPNLFRQYALVHRSRV